MTISRKNILRNNSIAFVVYAVSEILLSSSIPQELRFMPFMFGLIALYVFCTNFAIFAISEIRHEELNPDNIGRIAIGTGILVGLAQVGAGLYGTGVL